MRPLPELDQSWRSSALCSSLSPEEAAELFFPEPRYVTPDVPVPEPLFRLPGWRPPEPRRFSVQPEDWLPGKAFCRPCPVRFECLSHALDTREPHGMWGGLTPSERADLLRSRSSA